MTFAVEMGLQIQNCVTTSSILLEKGQKCIFYVILWVYGLLEGPCGAL